MLEDLTKEQRFEILKNEFSTDIEYQKTMDLAWHDGANIEGYLDRLRKSSKEKADEGKNRRQHKY